MSQHSERIVNATDQGSLKTRLLTYDQLAVELGVCKETLYRWVKDGTLKPIRKGRRFTRFNFDDVVKRLQRKGA